MKVLHACGVAFRFVVQIVSTAFIGPLLLIWSGIRPAAIYIYKLVLIARGRLDTFFHAQHKWLAIFTHRSSVHVMMIMLAGTVVTINMTQAREVRAEDFAEGSLLSQVFSPNGETVITSEAYRPTQARYIDNSATVRADDGKAIQIDPNAETQVVISNTGSAVIQSNTLGTSTTQASAARDSIETYEVQSGDTASSIAEKFGVSTDTILWSNNLSDASFIRGGQQLYILPATGVAHTVQSGETISSIAQTYSADGDKILEFNGLTSAEQLKAGVEIIIPDGEKPTPVAPTPSTQIASTTSFRQTVGTASTAPTPAPSAPVASGGGYMWPTTTRQISQYYGYRHNGLDIDGDYFDPIYAAESGTVTTSGLGGGYGLQVVINHSNGTQTRYAHLQLLAVSVGQTVSKGTYLGEMGSTGNSTGAHLHYEIIVNGRTVNPFNYH